MAHKIEAEVTRLDLRDASEGLRQLIGDFSRSFPLVPSSCFLSGLL